MFTIATKPSVFDRCRHINEQIDGIQSFMKDKSVLDFTDEDLEPLALERMLEIICVAASHIPNKTRALDHTVEWSLFWALDRQIEKPLERTDPHLMDEAVSKLEPLRLFADRIISSEQTSI